VWSKKNVSSKENSVRILLKQLDYSLSIAMRWSLIRPSASSAITSWKSRAHNLIVNYNPSTIFASARLSKRITWLNIPQLKLGHIRVIFPNFQNCACYEKYLKDDKHNTHHWARKYARIFVLGHYLFIKAHSFPRASLSENCSLLGTDNDRGQISEHWQFHRVY